MPFGTIRRLQNDTCLLACLWMKDAAFLQVSDYPFKECLGHRPYSKGMAGVPSSLLLNSSAQSGVDSSALTTHT